MLRPIKLWKKLGLLKLKLAKNQNVDHEDGQNTRREKKKVLKVYRCLRAYTSRAILVTYISCTMYLKTLIKSMKKCMNNIVRQILCMHLPWNTMQQVLTWIQTNGGKENGMGWTQKFWKAWRESCPFRNLKCWWHVWWHHHFSVLLELSKLLHFPCLTLYHPSLHLIKHL